jgi:hypothetical protein
MSIASDCTTEQLIADLYKVSGKAEIVGGRIVMMSPTGDLPGDASYYTGPRAGMKFLPHVPEFAAEVRSEGDYGPAAEREMAAKRADYFAAGTKVVWDVDLLGGDVVRKFTPDAPTMPTVFRRDEVADAEPAVPGWIFPVTELFD